LLDLQHQWFLGAEWAVLGLALLRNDFKHDRRRLLSLDLPSFRLSLASRARFLSFTSRIRSFERFHCNLLCRTTTGILAEELSQLGRLGSGGPFQEGSYRFKAV